jgi:hypothetical protein
MTTTELPRKRDWFPGRPLTPVEVEEELARMSDLMEDSIDELKKRSLEAARAEANYRREFAKNFLMADEKTDKAREQRALHECGDLLQTRLIAAALRDSAEEACRHRRMQGDMLRTIAANARSAAEGRG